MIFEILTKPYNASIWQSQGWHWTFENCQAVVDRIIYLSDGMEHATCVVGWVA